MRLTATAVRTLSCASGKGEQVIFDDALPGFGMRVRATGAKTWLVQYAIAGRTRRVFLGSPDVVEPGAAREKAKDLLAAVRLGGDPAGEKVSARAESAHTFGALLPHFLETARHLEHHARPFRAYPIQALDRRTIAARLAEIAKTSGPAAANRVRTSLSAFLSWAAREGYVETNAAAFTNKAPENAARSRVLTDQELARIWRAAGDGQYGAIIKLLVLTGARRNEIGGLAWNEVDLEAATVTLPPSRTKNRREHIIPLSEPALAILKERWADRDPDRDLVFGNSTGGFQDWSGSKAELDQRLAVGTPVNDWTLHDFRRSLSTALHERFGTLPHIVEAILAHADGHQGGVAGVYNKSIYLDERRRALARWADHILGVATGKPAKAQVVTLGRKRK